MVRRTVTLIQKEGKVFIAYCEQFFSEINNTEKQYYHFREQFNQELDRYKRSALFLYLNRHGHHGLCRYNQSGGYNVPFGWYKKTYFPGLEMLTFYEKSSTAKITHADFRQTFSLAKPGDLIYCDPPYASLPNSTGFTSYTGFEFTEQDQIDLAKLAKNAANNGITVMISNHDTPFTRELYYGSEIKSFLVRRGITNKDQRSKPVQEIVAIFGI